jgi:hypothetical protein
VSSLLDPIRLQGITLVCVAWFLATPVLCQDTTQVSHSIFLLGDCGEYYVNRDPIGPVLRKNIAGTTSDATVLFLGDNVYPKGLAFEGERLREQGESVLQYQVDWIRGLPVKAYFIPGNHDWHHWGRKGLEYIGNQQRWIDSLRDDRITMLPRDGCPGPVEVPIDAHTVLVILDTQWFLHEWNKPGEESSCDAKTPADALAQLNDVFIRNRNKRVIIAAHHPLITYGEHGGVFPVQAHLFPLAELTHYMYIPMPVIGSIYPLYRKWFGHNQDTAHPVYRQLSHAIQAIMAQYPGTIYVAGHEHALQYISKGSSHFIVSGSAAKTEHVRKKGDAVFASDVRGFARIDLLTNGSAVFRFLQVDERNADGKEVFRKAVSPATVTDAKGKLQTDFRNQLVRIHASDQYDAGRTKQFLLGTNYRKTWSQDIVVPVFDIGSEKGGLKIVQRGGGMQTLSLRLEDSTGHEYVIRSVEKFPEHAVPEVLKKTFAQDLVQDQISASHPYGALVVPALAEAAGIYHTSPKLVYIPDDIRFEAYQQMFAGSLAIFEERPSGDWSDARHFGNSPKIINTAKVLEKLAADNDNKVDQLFVLRSRLFDLLIGDWDRHDDQWRWATFKDKKTETFRPIPRDRDQAFFVNEGKLAKVWSRKWALPKFEGFDEKIDWAPGLSFNARYFDRTFLSELTRENWIATVGELQHGLTNEVIEKAIRQWPQEIYDLDGERIISSLKARRDNLLTDALSLYEFLAKGVDVTGSDKAEVFNVSHLPGGDVAVQVFKLTKDGDVGKILFDRVFRKNETRELRLYGLGGDDKFNVSGSTKRPLTVRIIGGAGKDSLADNSRLRVRRTIFYDQYTDGVFSGRVRDKRAADNEVNEYNRKSFRYDVLAPLVYGNFNPDDGVFVGGGFIFTNHGFRKEPFRQRHVILATAAPLTLSFNFRYRGRYTNAIGKWDVDVDLDIKSPNYVNNFFGLGNESVFDRTIDDQPGSGIGNAIDYYRFRFEEQVADISFVRKFSNWGVFSIGPAYQRIEMEKPDAGKPRFISQFVDGVGTDLFDEYRTYGGANWLIGIDKRDDTKVTSRGVVVTAKGKNMAALNKESRSFSSYETSASFYYRFRVPNRLMFALRAGGGFNTGDYAFYQAQILDGKTELRGFRKTRFYGDSKFFNNAELRLTLTSFRSYLFPATVGILAFHDIGRVWYKDGNGADPSAADGVSAKWHQGWGGGAWFTPFSAGVISLEAGHSEEGTLVYLRLGFLF